MSAESSDANETTADGQKEKELSCDMCDTSYQLLYHLNQHKVNTHNWNFKECSVCHVKAKLEDTIQKHKTLKHSAVRVETPQDMWVKKLFSKPTYEYTFNGENYKKIKSFFNKSKSKLFAKLVIDLGSMVTDIVLFVGVCVEIENTINNEQVIHISNFAKELKTFSNAILVTDGYDNLVQGLCEAVHHYKSGFSGSPVLTIVHAKVRIEKWRPIICDHSLELPKEILAKRAVIQVNQIDDYNFKWAIIIALNNSEEYVTNRGRMTSYSILDISERIVVTNGMAIDFSGLDFPMPLRDIRKFEQINPNISVNVFGYERNLSNNEIDIIGPLYRCKAVKEHHVNLLLIGTVEMNNYRFCFIRNMSRLVQSQRTLKGCRSYMCFFCMRSFNTQDKLDRHKPICTGVLVPLKRKNHMVDMIDDLKKPKHTGPRRHKLPLPFYAFANYETISIKQPDGCKSVHPCGFGFYIKCNFDSNLSVMHSDQGANCASNFVENLIVFISRLFMTYVYSEEDNPLQTHEPHELQSNSNCCVCHKDVPITELQNLFYKPTMRYIGPSHITECRQYFNKRTYVPIFLPSLEDVGLFSNYLDEYPGTLRVSRDSGNGESVTSMSKFVELLGGCILELRFLDLNPYIAGKMDYITNIIKYDDFKIMKNVIKDERKVYLMQQKLFPFKYATSLHRLKETELPPKIWFDEFGEDAYEIALEVWTEFNCITLRDFLMVFLESEVLLQIDVFEFFSSRQKGANMLANLHYDLKYIGKA